MQAPHASSSAVAPALWRSLRRPCHCSWQAGVVIRMGTTRLFKQFVGILLHVSSLFCQETQRGKVRRGAWEMMLMGTARSSCRRPGRWLLAAALFVALSCPARGLKSLASEGESEHKVRAMLQAATSIFEAQLGESQTSEEYVLTPQSFHLTPRPRSPNQSRNKAIL